jgi:hypothetical protein
LFLFFSGDNIQFSSWWVLFFGRFFASVIVVIFSKLLLLLRLLLGSPCSFCWRREGFESSAEEAVEEREDLFEFLIRVLGAAAWS